MLNYPLMTAFSIIGYYFVSPQGQLCYWTKKFTLKTENVKFLTSLPQVVLQDVKNPLRGLIRMQLNY